MPAQLTLAARLVLNPLGFNKGLQKAGQSVAGMDDHTRRAAASARRFARGMGQLRVETQAAGNSFATAHGKLLRYAGGFVGVGAARAALRSVTQASIRQEQALAQVEARLRSTGYAAGLTSGDLAGIAADLQDITPVNLHEAVAAKAMNVNMVSCGGQATIPLVAAVSRVQEVSYAEIVATVSSKSAGPGTRKNIDEFTRTTANGISRVGGAGEGKAIIIINPAEPPLIMRDTIHCLTVEAPDQEAISRSVQEMMAEVQKYVPGYRLKNGPVFDGNRVSIYLEVAGLGDFLPRYAGNLDIMTAAGLRTGELYAQLILDGEFVPTASAA